MLTMLPAVQRSHLNKHMIGLNKVTLLALTIKDVCITKQLKHIHF